MSYFFNQVFLFCVKNKSQVISIFKIVYLVLVIFLLAGSWSIYFQTNLFSFFYSKAILFGQIGLLLYIVTTIPGITRRFNIRHPLIQVVMLFRRYIGITVFLSVLIHYWFQRGILLLQRGFFLPQTLFEYMGFFAFSLLFLMFLTSNEVSVKRLGRWWGRIHSVTYVVVWLIFLHTVLQCVSIWSVLAGITAVLQISSHIYKRLKKPISVIPVTSQSQDSSMI